jgi:hypothetical protein
MSGNPKEVGKGIATEQLDCEDDEVVHIWKSLFGLLGPPSSETAEQTAEKTADKAAKAMAECARTFELFPHFS